MLASLNYVFYFMFTRLLILWFNSVEHTQTYIYFWQCGFHIKFFNNVVLYILGYVFVRMLIIWFHIYINDFVMW
jgi:hypothetical protein